MWQTVENGEDIRPAAIDDTSSRAYAYVRRNIRRVEASDDTPAHYRWEETKIPREALFIYQQTAEHENMIDDVYSALVELAELVTSGGE